MSRVILSSCAWCLRWRSSPSLILCTTRRQNTVVFSAAAAAAVNHSPLAGLRSAGGLRAMSSFTPSRISPRKRMILLGVAVFASTAIANVMYQEWKQQRLQRELIRGSHFYFDPNERQLKHTADAATVSSSYSAVQPVPKSLLDLLQDQNQLLVARRVVGPAVLPDIRITLFQYQTCPFCCKVRSFLDFYGLSYDVVEVNPVMRQQLRLFPADHNNKKKVPILVISRTKSPTATTAARESSDKEFIEEPIWISDSSLIISLLASYFTCNPGLQDSVNRIADMYPSITFASLEEETPRPVSEVVNKYYLMKGDQMNGDEYKRVIAGLNEERKWREWADRVLVHTLSPNVYRTLDESLHTFTVFSRMGDWERVFSTWERLLITYVGAVAMWVIGKRLAKRHRLKQDVRESLFDATREWLSALKGRTFLGGEKPNLADLAVYGVYHSIEGTDAFSELLMQQPKLKRWYQRVQEQCLMRQGHGEIALLLKQLQQQ